MLVWINLTKDVSKKIWSSNRLPNRDASINNCRFDKNGIQLAFIVEYKNDIHRSTAIWYYHSGCDSATVCVGDQTDGFDKGLKVSNNFLKFNEDGTCLLFDLELIHAPHDPSEKGLYL